MALISRSCNNPMNMLGTKMLICFMSLWTLHTVKTIPVQAWAGPEGSRRLRLPDFMTFGT